MTTGLLSQGQNLKPVEMPGMTAMPDSLSFNARNVGVNVTAPSSRSYQGFSENKSYDDRASNFKVSDDALVENRLTGLLGSNSDYLKRAKGISNVAANRRGMLNSSIAAGAGAAAAIDAALPIAQQDAGTLAQSDLSKQSYYNQTGLAEKAAYDSSRLSAQDATQQSGAMKQQFENTAGLNNQQGQINENLGASSDTRQSGLQTNQGRINQTLQYDSSRQQSALQAQGANENLAVNAQAFEFNKTLQQMDQDSRAALQQMQNENAQLLQQSQSASNRFQDLSQQIATISTSPDMNPEQKAAAINQLMELSNKSLATQSALLKAAGIEGVELTSEGTTGVPDIEVPSSASDPQLQFNPSEYDAGNYEALQTEARRLNELANRLPANTPEGIAVRVSLKEIEIKELEIQYAATTSKNKHREINGVMARRQKELDALKQSLAALSPQSLPATPTVLHDDFKPETEYQKEDFSLAAKSISKQMLSALGR